MNLASLFPPVQFSNAELMEIAKAMNNPAVKKYLRVQQGEYVKGIANGLPNEATNESAESYVRRQAVVVGSLEVIESLLSIEAPTTAA